MTTEVHDATERSRYEITVAGELAGFAEYLDLVPKDRRAAFGLDQPRA